MGAPLFFYSLAVSFIIDKTVVEISGGFDLSFEDIEQAAKMLMQAEKVVVLTGSGISVESGIPDFRSPDGLWARYDPMVCAAIDAFLQDPSPFWKMSKELDPLLENAMPNSAHHALRELETLGKCDVILTQNIDNLHQKAGSEKVLELHGTFMSGHCVKCRRTFTYEQIRSHKDTGDIPRCPQDEDLIKPDVVFFGEALDSGIIETAARHSMEADLMLVIGCGLEVFPAAALPLYTKKRGGKLIFFNVIETPDDALADLTCIGKAGETVPELLGAYRSLIAN